ncbi:hypothetical protein D1AOALGA4SA_2674 [Olavius algarvensis Delta 1 endosymbiont]|nr:hypothetical protein D1AOALGA4SA_2674 [Olavius algarvensis Delta 1 endosymbiont]
MISCLFNLIRMALLNGWFRLSDLYYQHDNRVAIIGYR